MNKAKVSAQLLDGVNAVIVIADENFVIQYINNIGALNYARFGGKNIVGTSLFDCHKPESHQPIKDMYESFKNNSVKVVEKSIPMAGKQKKILYLPIFQDNEFKGVNEIQYFTPPLNPC